MPSPLNVKSAGTSKLCTKWTLLQLRKRYLKRTWRNNSTQDLRTNSQTKMHLYCCQDYLPILLHQVELSQYLISASTHSIYRAFWLGFLSKSSSSFFPLNLPFLSPITFPSKLQHWKQIWCLGIRLGKQLVKNCFQSTGFSKLPFPCSILHVTAVTTV